jgi:tetratricopeptide (TPR) repeat protein
MTTKKIGLKKATTFRKNGHLKRSLSSLQKLIKSYPTDPDVNYQLAWAFDILGRESSAAQFYEKALALGLKKDRVGALLGLGSTYRHLGQYKKSLKILDQGIAEFPCYRALQVFRALTLAKLNKDNEVAKTLLTQLLETTNDSSIKLYKRALLSSLGLK